MSESSVDPSSFRPFEVSPVHLVYVGLGFFIVLFGMFSLFIKERLYLGEAPLAAVFGIIVGPACLNLFNPSHWANNDTGAPGGQITDEISLEVLRVTIALSVFAVGVELPKKYLLRHWRSIAFLLGPVMVWGWLITAAFMYALIPGLDFLNSLVVASCVTPTDPILAQAVVGGPWAEKHVPAHLRHILMCESGCNDGAAFPFLYLALFLSTNRDNHGKAIAEWFYDAWAYQIIFGTLLGALIGWAARKLMRFSERHKLVDRESFVAQYVSLAIASMGVNVLLGSDDLLAAFACGTAFAWDGWFTRQTEDSNFSSIVDLLFNVAVFIYIGSLMPFQDWTGGSSDEPNTLSLWRLFVLAFCVLLTKRIPVVIALWRWIPDIKTFREAVFAGHFGPIGVGAIFIATLARTELPEHIPSPPQSSNDILALTVQPVIYFFVICSIALHGLTIPFFAFSKGASRLTRTWSRNPSFAAVDGEPNWVSRMRSKRTGESLRAEEGNMTEIERVLNAQLRQIGKGAIGGDAEKDMSRSATQNGSGGSRTSDSEDPSHHLNEGAALRQRRRAQGDGDADGDAFDSPSPEDPQSGDWDGEDTIEMRRYLEKQKAKKEDEYAALRRKQQDLDEAERESRDSEQRDHHEGDLGAQKMLDEERGPMDRDIPRTRSEEEAHQDKSAKAELKEDAEHGDAQSKGLLGLHLTSSASSTSSAQQEREHAKVRAELEEPFPRMRSWVEGDQLVIEYQKHRFSDVECHTLPLFDHERDSISSSDDPAHTWAIQHAEALEHYGGFSGVRNWSTSEAMHYLVDHGIPKRYTDAMLGRKKRRPSVSESKEDRDSRFNALYGGIAYASQRRDKENGDGMGGSSRNEATHEHEHESERQSRPRSRKTSKAPKGERQRTPSPEVIGWLAARPVKPGKVTGPAGSSRRTSQQRLDKHGASSPTRSNSPPMRTGSSIRFAPREHKLACDSRRRSTRKKVLAGRVSLGPLASLAAGAAHVKEEVIETQSKEKEKESARRTGINVERSTSTGGLASEAEPSTSSSPAGHIRSFLGRQSDALFGNLPKTSSVGSIGGGSVRKPIHTNTQSSTSTTANWVDVNDRSHDNSRSLHSRRSESPSRMSTMELEKARSGHANDNRMHGYMPRSETIDSRHSNSEPRASDTSQHSSTHRKIGRLSTMLSTVTAHAAHVPRHLPGMRQEHTDRQPQSGSLRSASSTTQSLTPTAPAPIIHTYSANETGSGGGILADSSSSIAPSERQSVHSGTMSRHSTMPEQHEDPSGHHHTAERGVTFDV